MRSPALRSTLELRVDLIMNSLESAVDENLADFAGNLRGEADRAPENRVGGEACIVSAAETIRYQLYPIDIGAVYFPYRPRSHLSLIVNSAASAAPPFGANLGRIEHKLCHAQRILMDIAISGLILDRHTPFYIALLVQSS